MAESLVWFKTDKPCRMTWVFFVIVGCGGKKGGRKRKMFCGEQRPVRVGDKRLGVGEENFFFFLSLVEKRNKSFWP